MSLSLKEKLFTKLTELTDNFKHEDILELKAMFNQMFQHDNEEDFLNDVVKLLLIQTATLKLDSFVVINGTVKSVEKDLLLVEDQNKKIQKIIIPDQTLFNSFINCEVKIIAEITDTLYLPHEIHIKNKPKQQGKPVA